MPKMESASAQVWLHLWYTILNKTCKVSNAAAEVWCEAMLQDLLARRQQLAEQRRPRDEESLQHCTGRPAISAFAHSLRRSTSDLLAW